MKGKEFDVFDKPKILYEGNYIKGKKSKGKEYDEKGKLKYEGEFSNGKYNGLGKEYSYYGYLRYEGEFLDGVRWDGLYKEYLKGELINTLKYNRGYSSKGFFR